MSTLRGYGDRGNYVVCKLLALRPLVCSTLARCRRRCLVIKALDPSATQPRYLLDTLYTGLSELISSSDSPVTPAAGAACHSLPLPRRQRLRHRRLSARSQRTRHQPSSFRRAERTRWRPYTDDFTRLARMPSCATGLPRRNLADTARSAPPDPRYEPPSGCGRRRQAWESMQQGWPAMAYSPACRRHYRFHMAFHHVAAALAEYVQAG